MITILIPLFLLLSFSFCNELFTDISISLSEWELWMWKYFERIIKTQPLSMFLCFRVGESTLSENIKVTDLGRLASYIDNIISYTSKQMMN